MDDFESRARRAGAAIRDEARQRARELQPPTVPASRHARTGRSVAIGAAAAAGIAVVLAIMFTGDDVVGPVIDPVAPEVVDDRLVAADGVLPVPAAGEALAAYLDDGRPVFVSHPDDGEVVVLDAVDSRTVGGWRQLVTYCPSSGWFNEPRHQSRFNGWGEWTGGPSPAGLAPYPSELIDDGDAVRVTGQRQAHPEREGSRGQAPQGPRCVTDEGHDGPVSVYHRPSGDPPRRDADDLPEDRWVWATLVLGGTLAEPLVCQADGTCPDDAPRVEGIEGGDPEVVVDRAPRAFMARATGEGSVELLMQASGRSETHPTVRGAQAQQLLRLPEPGNARAAQLTDNAAVVVSRDVDGEVSVLDATSPANPTSLVGWCEADAVFIDGDGVLYGPHGRPAGGTAPEGLRRYPFELVDVGETQAIRVTGDAIGGHTGLAERGAAGCAGEELVMHLPDEHGHVYDVPVRMAEQPWTWVRMSSRVVDGDLYLCAGSGPCGEPGEPGVNEVCRYEELGNEDSELICELYRDPVIVTPGATPSETPRLMLVSSDNDGRTVEIRRPPTTPAP